MKIQKTLSSMFAERFHKIFDYYAVVYFTTDIKIPITLPESTLFALFVYDIEINKGSNSAPLLHFFQQFYNLVDEKKFLDCGFDTRTIDLGAIEKEFTGFYLFLMDKDLQNKVLENVQVSTMDSEQV